MEILQALGQVPLMFLGAFLFVLALAVAWVFARTRQPSGVSDRGEFRAPR